MPDLLLTVRQSLLDARDATFDQGADRLTKLRAASEALRLLIAAEEEREQRGQEAWRRECAKLSAKEAANA